MDQQSQSQRAGTSRHDMSCTTRNYRRELRPVELGERDATHVETQAGAARRRAVQSGGGGGNAMAMACSKWMTLGRNSRSMDWKAIRPATPSNSIALVYPLTISIIKVPMEQLQLLR